MLLYLSSTDPAPLACPLTLLFDQKHSSQAAPTLLMSLFNEELLRKDWLHCFFCQILSSTTITIFPRHFPVCSIGLKATFSPPHCKWEHVNSAHVNTSSHPPPVVHTRLCSPPISSHSCMTHLSEHLQSFHQVPWDT